MYWNHRLSFWLINIWITCIVNSFLIKLSIFFVQESDASLYKTALDTMSNLIKAATTSMTSVPKPLKFLRPHYETIKGVYEKITAAATKVELLCVLIVWSRHPRRTMRLSALLMTWLFIWILFSFLCSGIDTRFVIQILCSQTRTCGSISCNGLF